MSGVNTALQSGVLGLRGREFGLASGSSDATSFEFYSSGIE